MKKHMPGFVPVSFNKVGIILLILGVVGLSIKIISYLSNWYYISGNIMYFGFALILISLYLIFVVPKEK